MHKNKMLEFVFDSIEMRRAPVIGAFMSAALIHILSSAPANAQQIDAGSCVAIKNNNERLACFDSLATTQALIGAQPVKDVKLSDLKLDGVRMIDQHISTNGLIQFFGDGLTLKLNSTDTNSIIIDYKKLQKNDINKIYALCTNFKPCTAKVVGQIAKEPYLKDKVRIIAGKIEIENKPN